MSYTVIRVDLAQHRDLVFSVWERNAPGVLATKYRWIYEDNPAGTAQVWMVRHDPSSRHVGVVAVFPRRLAVNGSLLRGGIVGDFLVDPDHRGAGPALMLQRQVLSSVEDGTFDLLYGFPNKAAEPIVKRVGYRLLGERVRLVKTLKFELLIEKRVGNRLLAGMTGPIANVAMRALSEGVWSSPDASFVCEEVCECDIGFDRLWERTMTRYGVFGERTSEYLNWKYMRAPGGAHRVMAVRSADGISVIGYVIYRLADSQIEIRDISLPDDPQAAAVLMSRLARDARASGVISIVLGLMQNENARLTLRKFGFVERREALHAYLTCSATTWERFPSLALSAQWWLLQSDDDT